MIDGAKEMKPPNISVNEFLELYQKLGFNIIISKAIPVRSVSYNLNSLGDLYITRNDSLFHVHARLSKYPFSIE